jgi:hypothetical protein
VLFLHVGDVHAGDGEVVRIEDVDRPGDLPVLVRAARRIRLDGVVERRGSADLSDEGLVDALVDRPGELALELRRRVLVDQEVGRGRTGIPRFHLEGVVLAVARLDRIVVAFRADVADRENVDAALV